MAKVKELYKGQSLDDLEQYYQLPDLKISKLAVLLSTAQKVYRKAEECYIDGDEELSYIYFMRYFNLIDHIRKMPDYASNKQQVAKSLGHHKQLSDVMDKTESLSNSLKKRYAAKLTKRTAALNDIITPKSLNNTNADDDDSEMAIEELKCVTPGDLYNQMQDRNTSLLIMDCRPEVDFQKSRLKYASCINVPAEIILPGMTAGKIQQQLEPNSKSLWSSRMVKDNVVLMDWNTKSSEPILHSPLWRLRDILQNWDPDATYRSPIRTLIGGYENLILMYPMQSTNPAVQAPVELGNDSNVLDDIEYPSINDITMKDTNKFESASTQIYGLDPARPKVDRKSKMSAIKTYDEKQKVLDVLRQREALLEKVVENERERLKAENDWKSLKQTDTVEQKETLMSREQELLYNIMQLESKERDYQVENERLMQQIEEYKQRELEMNKILSEKEAETVKKTEKNIEVKLKEASQIDEQREKITQEREKQLAHAREQKRHLKPPSEEEEISKPKIPQFDRSAKPMIAKVAHESFETSIQRDFAGVSGGMTEEIDRAFNELFKKLENMIEYEPKPVTKSDELPPNYEATKILQPPKINVISVEILPYKATPVASSIDVEYQPAACTDGSNDWRYLDIGQQLVTVGEESSGQQCNIITPVETKSKHTSSHKRAFRRKSQLTALCESHNLANSSIENKRNV